MYRSLSSRMVKSPGCRLSKVRAPHIEMSWADGDYRFALLIGELRELQDKTGVGPLVLYRRIASGDWHVDDMREVLRLGLIGGGMGPGKALGLVKRYVEELPLVENVEPALKVLEWALIPPEEDKGEGDDASGKLTAEAILEG